MEDSPEEQRTVWCGNFSEKMTEEILYELFLQAAPLERVHIPKDPSGKLGSYGFVTFKHTCSVPYSIDLLNGIALYNKKLIIKPRARKTEQSKTFQSYNNAVNSPFAGANDIQNRIDPLENINLLMQLGDQLVLNNNRHYFSGDYRNEWSSNNTREHSNYYNDRRDDSRPYRRHNHNNRYNSNGRPYERNRDRY